MENNKTMINWIKRNKLSSILILFIAFIFLKQFFGIFNTDLKQSLNLTESAAVYEQSYKPLSETGIESSYIPLRPAGEAPPTDTTERLLVQESYLSLVVKNVNESVNQIISKAEESGGYMVSSNLSQPEEAPYAKVVLRIPAERLTEILEYFRNLSVKVSSENLLGTDVTDQYEDLESRLKTYEKTKIKFEGILEQATQIQDILNIQREIINIQQQIDNIKGRQLYLEQTAKLAKITLHISTDEWSLPYTPSKPFRANVIFKEAVRSLILTIRGLAEKAIWIIVYGAIWVPPILIFILLKKLYKNRKIKKTEQSSLG